MSSLCFCLRSLFAEPRQVISGLLEAQCQTNPLIPSLAVNQGTIVCPLLPNRGEGQHLLPATAQSLVLELVAFCRCDDPLTDRNELAGQLLLVGPFRRSSAAIEVSLCGREDEPRMRWLTSRCGSGVSNGANGQFDHVIYSQQFLL